MDALYLPRRAWINQPSTAQALHHLHGTNVLAVPDVGSVTRVYFLFGDVLSQQVPTAALSEGWTSASTRRGLTSSGEARVVTEVGSPT